MGPAVLQPPAARAGNCDFVDYDYTIAAALAVPIHREGVRASPLPDEERVE